MGKLGLRGSEIVRAELGGSKGAGLGGCGGRDKLVARGSSNFDKLVARGCGN